MVDTGSAAYLNLGGALAAFGLIFAVYQLRREQWDVVLRIRPKWQRNVFWLLGAMGLLFTLASTMMSMYPCCNFWRPFTLPLTFQIAAYCCFIGSPVSLFILSERASGLFYDRSAKRFYTVLVQMISRTNDRDINAATDVMLWNFDDICKAAIEPDQHNDSCQYARAILDVILSDQSVAVFLATKRLDALRYVLSVVEKYRLSRSVAGIGIPWIVHHLFYEEESFLYKHLHSKGLALSSDIYRSIFDSAIVLSNFDLFEYPTIEYSTRRVVSNSGIEVYIEALSRSIKTYLTTGEVPPIHINHGISHLNDIFGDLCSRVRVEQGFSEGGSFRKGEAWALHLIAKFLGHDYIFLADEEELESVRRVERTAEEINFQSATTINAAVAAAIYKAFEALSSIKVGFDSYQTVLELLHGMMYEPERKFGYRDPFERRLWQQVGVNLFRRWYPVPVRAYLQIIGFLLVSGRDQNQPWIAGQVERTRRFLYVDLKPLLDLNAEMIDKQSMRDALLPEMMDYNDGRFFYRPRFGKGDRIQIEPPEDGAASALEGVDLEKPPMD